MSGRRPLLSLAILALALAAGLLWWAALLWPDDVGNPVRGRLQCVSYAPFRKPGESPMNPAAYISPARIDRDLARLSQRFDCVRTYAVGQGLDQVPAMAARHGMQVLMGVWIGPDADANAREIAHAIRVARSAPPGSIRAIVFGNEVLLRGDQPVHVLLNDLYEVRAATGLPVTYADVWAFWLRHPQLAPAVDFISVHMLPYWDNDPASARDAVARVARLTRRVEMAFPGKPVFIAETGWPSAGRARRDAVPGQVNEARYLRGFVAWARTSHQSYNLIEAYDQPWKRAQEGTVGGWWGIDGTQARPKFSWQGPVQEDPRAWWALLPMLLGGMSGLYRIGRRARLHGLLAGASTGLALWALMRMARAAAFDVATWAYWLTLGTGLLVAAWITLRALGDLLRDGRIRARERLATLLFAALFATVYIDLLLVFDGRYRDWPLPALLPVAIGMALLRGLDGAALLQGMRGRTLAWIAVLLGAVSVAQEHALNPYAWTWLGASTLLAWAALGGGDTPRVVLAAGPSGA